MNNKNKEKDLIIGDVHGCADRINKNLKDIGFETSKNHIINVGSPPEKTLQGEIPDLFTIMKKVKENIHRVQKDNEAHHDAQYKKFHRSKKK